jgi:hypothetical protein
VTSIYGEKKKRDEGNEGWDGGLCVVMGCVKKGIVFQKRGLE